MGAGLPFTDALGRSHPAAGSEARIVSLVPSLTELIADLGLAGQLVGRTRYCVHPRSLARQVPAVGGTKDPDLERIRALAPTHVLLNVDENTRETAAALEAFVPHVVVTHPQAPEDNLALYRLLGGLFGREREAERLAQTFAIELAETRRAGATLPVRRVLYLIWRRPWMTVGPDTYIARTLALVNWQQVATAGAARYPEVTLSRDLLSSVDLVLLPSEPFPFRERHGREIAGWAAGLEPEPAIVPVDGELVSWYGSRAIRGLEYLRTLASSGV